MGFAMDQTETTSREELDQLISAACSGLIPEPEFRSRISNILYEQYVLGYEAAGKKVQQTLETLNERRI